MSTNRDLLAQRLSDRPSFLMSHQSGFEPHIETSFTSKKKINENPVQYTLPNKINNFNQAIMGKDLRKPDKYNNQNIQFSGATRGKRNSDLLNQRAERFTPISQHKPFPFLTGEINYNNKPQSTRDTDLSHTIRKN